MRNSDTLAEKMICKYTETSQRIIAKTKDTIKHIFSATSSLVFIKSSDFKMPPPSKIDTGYKFISASEALSKEKVDRVSFFCTFIKKVKRANSKLKMIPPRHTSASFL